MTYFGKMLVFFNLLLSMLITGWVIGIYTERVEWAPAWNIFGEQIENRQGKLSELAKEIELDVERREVAERRWQAGFRELPQVEKHRFEYQAWYSNLMHATLDGNDLAGNVLKPPVRVLVRDDKSHELLRDGKDGKIEPVKRIGIEFAGDKAKEEDLQYAEYYERKIKEVREAVDKLQKQLDMLIEEHTKLSEEIAGVAKKPKVQGPNGRFLKDKSGLQDQRDNQVAYLKNCIDEQKYLMPLVNNTRSELVLLAKRQAALKARLKELEKVAVNR